MLGKLIKYDMKALNRFLILIHGFLLFAALLVRFFLTGACLWRRQRTVPCWASPSCCSS